MKKTFISLAVAGIASSVNAAEIYSMDGVTLDLSGEVDVQYFKDQDKSVHSQWTINEANFGFDLTYEMTEDLLVGTHMDIDANDGDSDNDGKDDVNRGDVYGKIVIDQVHTITFGSQSTILDEAGIGDDYEFGFTSFVENADYEGDQVIKYKYDGGEMFYGGIAYLENRNSTSTTTFSDDYQVDGNIGARINDLELTLFLARAQEQDRDISTYDIEARYTVGDWLFAGTYGTSQTEQTDGTDRDKYTYGVTASWADGGRFEYAAGWAITDTKNSIESSVKNGDINDFYANVTYSLSTEVALYAEIGLTDEDDMETGYVVGLDATF
ncbi:porin [Vibrio salinus]|uniref:porin n=1 Tax=Vibrio salinus TaxID=2899784 RepID=UPI001E3B3F8E|nr:porin [Vibrio salinus]MCE0493294.1 porin [Vibrio salinus]